MEPIELSRWEPSPEDPRRKQYAGQRTAQEVFEELRHRLEGMGYLPDEYFLMNRDWENGREIPRGADIFCTTDYGGSEGIYLDVSLQWYENDRTVTRNFITGKTLGETGADGDSVHLQPGRIRLLHHDRSWRWAVHTLRSLLPAAGIGGQDSECWGCGCPVRFHRALHWPPPPLRGARQRPADKPTGLSAIRAEERKTQ